MNDKVFEISSINIIEFCLSHAAFDPIHCDLLKCFKQFCVIYIADTTGTNQIKRGRNDCRCFAGM